MIDYHVGTLEANAEWGLQQMTDYLGAVWLVFNAARTRSSGSSEEGTHDSGGPGKDSIEEVTF